MIKNYSLLTLEDLFSSSLENFSGRVAYELHDKEKLSYLEVGRRVNHLTELFNKNGVGNGDKISLLGENMPNWPVSFFAAVTSGRVAVPLLPDFTAFEIVNILSRSGSDVLIVSGKLLYKIPERIYKDFRLVIQMDDLSVIKESGREDQYLIPQPPQPSDIAAISYTSGTSGTPKGVMLSHGNLVSQVHMANTLFPVFKEDLFLSILPLSHTYECSIGMLHPFAFGAHVVYLDRAPAPSVLMQALENVKPTIILSVPLIVEKIYKNRIRPMFTGNFIMRRLYQVLFIRRVFHKASGKRLRKSFGGNLRFLGIGGSKLSCVAEQFLRDANMPYSTGYGLTETSPLLTGAVPGKVVMQSAGQKLNGVELEILNPDNEGVGEIVVKGPNVMAGYYNDPEATAACLTEDGWFHTKDLGKLDSNGNLFVKGRMENMISAHNGVNIYPEEIESVINEHDLVLESLVCLKDEKLVAKVCFNYEMIESLYPRHKNIPLNMDKRFLKIKQELLDYVNNKLGKSTEISLIEEHPVPFEKSATQRIKRYLYCL
jgi:long-chain acyl-CoA synthetase